MANGFVGVFIRLNCESPFPFKKKFYHARFGPFLHAQFYASAFADWVRRHADPDLLLSRHFIWMPSPVLPKHLIHCVLKTVNN